MVALAGTVGLPLFLPVSLTCWLGAPAVGAARDDGLRSDLRFGTKKKNLGGAW